MSKRADLFWALPVAFLSVGAAVAWMSPGLGAEGSILQLRDRAMAAEKVGDQAAALRAWTRITPLASSLDVDRVESLTSRIHLLASLHRCDEIPPLAGELQRRYRLHPMAAYGVTAAADACATPPDRSSQEAAVRRAVESLDEHLAGALVRVAQGAQMAGTEQRALRWLGFVLTKEGKGPGPVAARLMTELAGEARRVPDTWLPTVAIYLLMPAISGTPERSRALLDVFGAWDPRAAAPLQARARQGALPSLEEIRVALSQSLGREVILPPEGR